ncbi:MAG: cupin domain-containing protein [Verrucomicrobiales bacterium]
MKRLSVISIITLVLFSPASAQESQKTAAHPSAEQAIHTPDKIKWQAGPPSLPAGAKMAVLEGDPAKEGFFTMRIQMPDGYKIAPHTHPKVEHITVLSGTFNFGMGEKFDQSATQPMPAGTFGFWPAGMKHFVWAKGETVVQLHGIGPWKIEYVNPADDPRKAR